MKALATPIWVRLPNLPLHFWTPHFLSTIGNSLGRFIKINGDRISKGLVTFARICMEMDLNAGLSNRILIDWTNDEPYIHLLDYKNTSLRCRSCQQPGHLRETCHFFSIQSPTPIASKKLKGWKKVKHRSNMPSSHSPG